VVDAAPFRETARLTLMEVLHARGNVAEALLAYEDTRVFLRDELGTAPGAALQALHEQLLRGDGPAPAPGGNDAAPGAAHGGAAHGGRLLVGRDSEQAELARVLDDALAGAGRVALIEGAAGIGKSRLLASTRQDAVAAGARVAAARASQLERDFPFGVVRQLFEAHIADPARRAALLQGAAAPAARVLSAPDATPEGDASFAALHGLYWLALNLAADAPLVIAVDDLHWVDVPSLRFLAYLSRRLEGLPIGFVATLRTGEDPTDAGLLAEILHDSATARIVPGPLDEAAVAALVTERLGAVPDAAFLAACHATTSGNPLLVSQLLSALRADDIRPDAAHADTVRAIGSRAVAATVRLRLDRLPDDARATARSIAVLGEDAVLGAVAELAGLDEARVAASVADLARADILSAGAGLTFSHPLVLEGVAATILPGERDLAHARAAVLARDRGAPRERVATHLLQAPPRGEAWVVDLLRQCAATALSTGGAESASAYLQRALTEPPAPESVPQVRLELGLAEALRSAPAAVEHLRAALDATTDPEGRARIAHVLSRVLMFSGDPVAGRAVALDVAVDLPDELDDERRALEAFGFVAVFFDVAGPAELAPLERYRSPDLRPGAGARMLAAISSLYWAHSGATAAEAGRLAHAAMADGSLIRRDNGLLSITATSVLDMAEHPEVLTYWDHAMREGHERGSLFSISAVHMWRGWTLLRRGELADARDSLELAFDEFELYGYGAEAKQYAGGFLGEVMLDVIGAHAARASLRRAGGPSIASNGGRYWRIGQCAMHLARGEFEEASAVANLIAERTGWIGCPADGMPEALGALALHGLGRTEAARDRAEAHAEAARHWGAPGTVGPALRVLGTIRGEDGLDDLEEAVALLETSTRRLELAKALRAHGLALVGCGDTDAGRDRLVRAHALATICSATPLAQAIEARLADAGGIPAPLAVSGADSLTSTEHRAASLAADGADDREVAQRLFLTPHAAQIRLDTAQRKLGAATRADLAAALG
jgi:DNA-binding CsgD family transcriptional regulator